MAQPATLPLLPTTSITTTGNNSNLGYWFILLQFFFYFLYINKIYLVFFNIYILICYEILKEIDLVGMLLLCRGK